MAKKKNRHNQDDAEGRTSSSVAGEEGETGPRPKMKRKEYERQMRILHGELVAMQEWVKDSGAKICIVFEGRDTAGKGGTIKRITERVSPRVFRIVALPTPTEREKSQMYVQRYIQHFPAAGEVVIFDRSWYNRAGVERVMGFCKPEETERFLELAPNWEKAMTDSGILLPLVYRGRRRQKARPAQHHQPPARPGPVQAARPPGHQAAQTAASRRLPAAGPATTVYSSTVLGGKRAGRRPRH